MRAFSTFYYSAAKIPSQWKKFWQLHQAAKCPVLHIHGSDPPWVKPTDTMTYNRLPLHAFFLSPNPARRAWRHLRRKSYLLILNCKSWHNMTWLYQLSVSWFKSLPVGPGYKTVIGLSTLQLPESYMCLTVWSTQENRLAYEAWKMYQLTTKWTQDVFRFKYLILST